MQTSVQKWGNGLGIRIPRSPADQAQSSKGSVVEVEEGDGVIPIRAVAPEEYALDELVAGSTEENRYGEVDTGEPMGREVGECPAFPIAEKYHLLRYCSRSGKPPWRGVGVHHGPHAPTSHSRFPFTP